LSWIFEGKDPENMKLSMQYHPRASTLGKDSGDVVRQPEVVAFQKGGDDENSENFGD
jgi:hypothetical protein